MADQHPGFLISIPRSLVSLKHYFEVHDQPFRRSVVFLLIVAVLRMAVAMVLQVNGLYRDAAEQRVALTEKLGVVSFRDGKATATGDQPRILWEERVPAVSPKAPEGRGDAAEAGPRLRAMVVVLDTTGKTLTLEKAEEFAGCALPQAVLFLGPERIEWFERGAKGKQKGKQETYDYGNKEKLAELRETLAANGGTFPGFEVVESAVEFELAGGKVHKLVHGNKLLVLVDTTPKGTTLERAVQTAGPPKAERVLLFGSKQIESVQGQSKAVCQYSDAAKLAELRELVKANGGEVPAFKSVPTKVKLTLPEGKVHLLCHTSALIAMANTTAETGPMHKALEAAVRTDHELAERLRPPPLFLFVSASGVSARFQTQQGDREVSALEFATLPSPTAQSVAGRAVAALRNMQVDAALRRAPFFLVVVGLELFVLALLSAVAGLVASMVAQGGLIYGELLNMAIYAGVPLVATLLVIQLAVRLSVTVANPLLWYYGVPLAVSIVYVVLGTLHTVRERGAEQASLL